MTAPSAGSLRILVVEDNPADARLVREAARECDDPRLSLVVAPTLAEAAERMAEASFDAVLLDLGLPDASGIEGLSLLSGLRPEVPVVVLSGLEDRSVALEAVRGGAQDYIVKDEWGGRGQFLTRTLLYAIERKRFELVMSHLAFHDSLTNLPNRRLLVDRLDQALARARRGRGILAILFVDLDGFKDVNDRLGHECGDELLRQVADRLRAHVRASDTVARVGGDEFTLVMPDLARFEDVAALASKVVERFIAPFAIQGSQVSVHASFGVSVYPSDGESAEVLLRKADAAMYAAKAAGRNRCHFASAPMGSRPGLPSGLHGPEHARE